MNALTEANWNIVAEAHGGELSPNERTKSIDLSRKPKMGRTARSWKIYSDALADLLFLAARGSAGIRVEAGQNGIGRILSREAK